MSPEQLAEHTFLLPGGLILDDGRRLSDVKLRPLTGHDEEWLAQHPVVPNAVAVTWLLSSCVVRIGDAAPTSDLVRKLLVGDRDHLVLQLRRLTLGREFQIVVACPECGAKMDVTVGLSDVPVESRPQTSASYALRFSSSVPSGRTVRFRLPTGADQEAVLGMDLVGAVGALFDRCVLDDGGVELSSGERQSVAEAMDRLAPQLEVELDLSCPECSHAFVMPFDTTTFFMNEMRTNGDLLLREVHALALHYHWSETAILTLTRDRRRAYLALLSDAPRND